MQPIKTKRLLIRGLQKEDAYWLYSYRAMPIVEKYQAWKHYSYDEAVALIDQMSERHFDGRPGVFQWGVEKEGRLIGDLYCDLNDDGVCWIGYTFDPQFWHQGYALEAVDALLRYLHGVFHIQVMMVRILPENLPSQRLAEKLGFRLCLPEIYVKNNW